MRLRYFWIVTTLILLVAALLTMVFYANADCVPGDTGTAGDDTINCTLANQPTADVQGLGGNDTIVIDSGVNISGNVVGDTAFATPIGAANDTIINNGTINGAVVGDSVNGGGSGNDVIVNNGTVNADISGDSNSGFSNSGSDTITNNGTVNGTIAGDSPLGPNATGNDNITNNGVVTVDIYGDGDFLSAGGGNDTINNSGVVGGSIYAGAGDDTVTLTGSGTVYGIMDGGADYDVLNFNLTSTDPAEIEAIAQQIAAANPAGGTLTVRGIVYTWQNFEELSTLLVSLVRLNGVGDPLAVFCALGGGIDVYAVVGNEGVLSLHVSAQSLSSAIAQAQAIDSAVQVDSSATSIVYAVASGDLQINSPNGFSFNFAYQTRCGALPEPLPFVEEEEIEDTFVIVNRPR